MTKTAAEPRPTGLLPRVTCPHCWEQHPPQKLLWISEHTNLLGDERLGPEQPRRFVPTRFTLTGEALDKEGFPCHQLACPNCHLVIPRSLLELEPLFLSIFGAPASGKSYFLAALTWELRKILPLEFRVGFADADPVLNQQLNAYEESVFSGSSTDEPVPLTSLIRKTEEQGDLYDTVSFGNTTRSRSAIRPSAFRDRSCSRCNLNTIIATCRTRPSWHARCVSTTTRASHFKLARTQPPHPSRGIWLSRACCSSCSIRRKRRGSNA